MGKQPIPQKTVEKVQPYLNPGEQLICARNLGIFGKGDLAVLTNRRHLLIEKGLKEGTAYLEEGEKILQFECQAEMATPADGWVYLLTNRRFLAVDLQENQWVAGQYLIDEITGVRVIPVRFQSGAMTIYQRGFLLSLEDGKSQGFVHNGPAMEDPKNYAPTWKGAGQVICENLPKSICLAARLPFSPPYHASSDPCELTCYVKTDLAFPQRCSACGAESAELVFDRLPPAAGIQYGNPGWPIIYNVLFEIPYCRDCHQKRFTILKKSRAVRAISFNGLEVTLAFDNLEYESEFNLLNAAVAIGEPEFI